MSSTAFIQHGCTPMDKTLFVRPVGLAARSFPMGMSECAHCRCQHCKACYGDAGAPDVCQDGWQKGLRTCDQRFPLPTTMVALALWATLTPRFLASLFVLLFPITAVADIMVNGDRTGFEQLLNDLLQGSEATVAI